MFFGRSGCRVVVSVGRPPVGLSLSPVAGRPVSVSMSVGVRRGVGDGRGHRARAYCYNRKKPRAVGVVSSCPRPSCRMNKNPKDEYYALS